MRKVLIVLAVILLVLLVVGVMAFSWIKTTYNTMVTMDEEVNGAWAQLENVYQRRFDLIPNLVETVKGYAAHENEVLTQVTEARAKVGGAGTPDARLKAEGELTGALSRLMVVVENYPDLKANQNFIMLQDQLEGTENRIAVERGRYINMVKLFNQYIRRFPTNLIASAFNFKTRETFESVEGAKTAPKVQFK
ncbi:LemA family protein [bacterium]|nr:LemA family protein [bacterium]